MNFKITKKYTKALLLAPLAAPAAYFLLLPVFIIFAPKEIMTHYAGLIFYGAYALPMAYIGAILIALPIIAIMKSTHSLKPVSLAIAGFIAGGVFFILLVSSIVHYSPSSITDHAWFLISGGIMGLSVAYLLAKNLDITNAKAQNSRA